ncbi:hypothetical protein BC751_1968 [Cecembia calidifontis]|uniref:Uncharacterized protein n=1 Tax=Cecembia calidifontis TaxID=1187080 RepID=A0A4Q7P914_9BACT|nr:hypothetical protein BC751_1968 [Cecembia calidifontis]
MEKLHNFFFFILLPLIILNQFIFQVVYLPSWISGLVLLLGAVLFFVRAMKMKKKAEK